MRTPFSKIDEIAKLQEEDNRNTIKKWEAMFKKNPKLKEDFLYWCADQGHFEDFHENFIKDPE